MNILPREKQIAAIAALCEGVSIRAVARLYDIDRGTVGNLALNVGKGCGVLHDTLMRDINVARIEADEIWQFVAKKKKNLKPTDSADLGDAYTFIGLAGAAKAIISYRVGKRTLENAQAFAHDLRARVVGAPEISTDGLPAYPMAFEQAFGVYYSHGVIEKRVAAVEAGPDAARRYSPGKVIAVSKFAVTGAPRKISTSYVERSNLSLRMHVKRYARLTNAFSKTFVHHCAATALWVSFYNFCRVHETLRITPAMQIGVTDHVWTVGELIAAALDGEIPAGTVTENPMNLDRADTLQSVRKFHPFVVIDGGKKP